MSTKGCLILHINMMALTVLLIFFNLVLLRKFYCMDKPFLITVLRCFINNSNVMTLFIQFPQGKSQTHGITMVIKTNHLVLVPTEYWTCWLRHVYMVGTDQWAVWLEISSSIQWPPSEDFAHDRHILFADLYVQLASCCPCPPIIPYHVSMPLQ